MYVLQPRRKKWMPVAATQAPHTTRNALMHAERSGWNELTAWIRHGDSMTCSQLCVSQQTAHGRVGNFGILGVPGFLVPGFLGFRNLGCPGLSPGFRRFRNLGCPGLSPRAFFGLSRRIPLSIGATSDAAGNLRQRVNAVGCSGCRADTRNSADCMRVERSTNRACSFGSDIGLQ
jgi:hypothetical protein